MRAPLTHALAVAAAATVLVLGSTADAAPYGTIAVAGNGVRGASTDERAARYRRLAEAGVEAVRVDMLWARVEPVGPPLGDYEFEDVEREVAAIRKAGLKVIGILGFGHPDYSLGRFLAPTPVGGGLPPFGVGRADFFPPLDPRPFAAYARAVAAHFGEEILAWEVWNEENGGWRFWPPKEDPAAYGRLLCAASEQVRAVDPRTPVVFGGLFFPEVAGLPGEGAVDFLDQAYAADPRLGRCFDALGYHPYAYPFTAPELDVPGRGSVLSAADQLRAVLQRRADPAKPLWITEVGWPSNRRAYGTSELKQAQYVARMAAATFAQGVPVLTFYTYGDEPDPTGGGNQEAAFGFFRADETPKPAYAALRTFTGIFRGARFAADRSRELGLPAGRQNLGGRGFALEYRRREERITAAWLAVETLGDGQGAAGDSGPGSSRRVRLALPARASHVEVVELLGERRLEPVRQGRIALTLGPSPQYVVDPAAPAGCQDRRRPVVQELRWRPRSITVRAADRGCAGLRRVLVAVARRAGRSGCRFLRGDGTLGRRAPCRRPRHLVARRRGSAFRVALPARLPSGRYLVRAVAIDRAGRVSRPLVRRAGRR